MRGWAGFPAPRFPKITLRTSASAKPSGIGAWPSVEAACEATIRPAQTIQPQHAAIMAEAYTHYRNLYPALKTI